MKVLIQRSLNSKVSIDGKIINEINSGLVILVAFCEEDDLKDIEYIINKIVNLRIFNDESGIMNKSILDIKGEILSISQFTLYASTKKGNRPSYIKALKSNLAIILYNKFNELLNQIIPVKTGVFGADMLVNINNDGPVTILIDSKE